MRYVSQEKIEEASSAINSGDILAVPTESFYSIVAKQDNIEAIRKLLDIKNSQIDRAKAMTLLLPDVDSIKDYAFTNREALNLARHYLPGELTLILPKRRALKHPYFNHFESVEVRVPEHPYLLKLLHSTGPLLAISAHARNQKPCKSSNDIAKVFPSVDCIVDGESGGNIPPTVVDWTGSEPIPIRQGGLLIVRYA